MELYFLDRQFRAVSPPIDTAVSAVWGLRFGECGTFAMQLPLTAGAATDMAYTPAELLALASGAVYLCDRQYCGRIETVICREHTLHIGGRLLECLLYDRVAHTETVYSGTVGQAVSAALAQWAGDLALTVAGEIPDLSGTMLFTMEAGEPLGRWLHRLLAPYGASYSVELRDGTVYFSVTVGTDRSLVSAPVVYRAIFSEDFGNTSGLETELYREDALNRVYVEGSDGTVVVVDHAEDNRKEGYRKAADIRPDEYSTAAAYQAALTRRGEEILQASGEISRLSCVGEYDVEPRYGRDYRLGDICEVQGDSLGVRRAVRLTAVDVV
ncbi:MAG: hypothetical protein IJX14_02645, partial [Clostridia bacterium]|nr:hypothetical protein [Clostridia bacterium]